MLIQDALVSACQGTPERSRWVESLPEAIRELQERWHLALGQAFDARHGTCAWVAPARRDDGSRAVLKLGMPHMEGAHELQGLRFWNGNPTVRLLEADEDLNAMLLERCEPGSALRELPEPEQDGVIAGLLGRLWRKPHAPHPFRPLSVMIAAWTAETAEAARFWPDAGLVREGLALFGDLANSEAEEMLLATDLHAGNVLSAVREPWLVIDPKPFTGDRAYDATQHLLNCRARLMSAPQTIQRFADLLEVDAARIRLWLFARAAAEPRELWTDESLALARALTPGV